MELSGPIGSAGTFSHTGADVSGNASGETPTTAFGSGTSTAKAGDGANATMDAAAIASAANLRMNKPFQEGMGNLVKA
ncbi:hypothetical protein Sya03_33270 [Spirilliplanes yamanashiensis]|uniref:Uncharacterized protein n=1 Tax=Spirilliplanes yamanashiensis TaxID=42233 RepID=A0A8J4DKE6_9ACTN|nr:hypothetical protein Sya03_33270 [Spirilliplanes yamanashiensis]